MYGRVRSKRADERSFVGYRPSRHVRRFGVRGHKGRASMRRNPGDGRSHRDRDGLENPDATARRELSGDRYRGVTTDPVVVAGGRTPAMRSPHVSSRGETRQMSFDMNRRRAALCVGRPDEIVARALMRGLARHEKSLSAVRRHTAPAGGRAGGGFSRPIAGASPTVGFAWCSPFWRCRSVGVARRLADDGY